MPAKVRNQNGPAETATVDWTRNGFDNRRMLYVEYFMTAASLSVTSLIFFSPALAQDARPFEQTLRLQGVTFKMKATNQGSLNKLSNVSEGLKDKPAPIEREIDGTVTGAEIADLDSKGSPEVYVYVTSAGSGGYGSVVAYAANKKSHSAKSICLISPTTRSTAKATWGTTSLPSSRIGSRVGSSSMGRATRTATRPAGCGSSNIS
jgi:hypothetical protein